MTKELTCQHADRDFKRMKCGYPLPCPYHTVIVHTDQTDRIKVEVPQSKSLDAKERRRLKRIGEVVK